MLRRSGSFSGESSLDASAAQGAGLSTRHRPLHGASAEAKNVSQRHAMPASNGDAARESELRILLQDEEVTLNEEPQKMSMCDHIKLYCKGSGIGLFVSALQIGVDYGMASLASAGSSPFLPPLVNDCVHMTAASYLARKYGHLCSVGHNAFEQYVIKPVLHIGTSVSLVMGYHAAVAAIGGDVEAPEMIPATIALEGCLAPLVQRAVEKMYFGSKHVFFKCAGATRSVCDCEPDEVPVLSGAHQLR